MELSQIFSLVSIIIAAVAVLVSIYNTAQSRKAVFSGAYFSEMVDAYAAYLKSVAEFVYNRDDPHRDALATSLHRTLLFASPAICSSAQELYLFVMDWSRSGMERPLPVDQRLNELGNLMRKDIDQFRKHGHREEP